MTLFRHFMNRSGRASAGILAVLALLLALPLLFASPPAWWTERGVLNPGGTADDFAALNQGQLKNLASKAYAELQETLPVSVWSTTEGEALAEMVNAWSASTTADNFAAVNQGQLKTVAKAFYDVLALPAVGYAAGLGLPPDGWTTGDYPWTAATTDDDAYAAANIGQAKYVFSFDPSLVISPVAPGNVSAVELDDGSIEFTWSDNSNNETGFTIQRSDDGGQTWTTVATIAANGTNYVLAVDFAGTLGSSQFHLSAGNLAGTTYGTSSGGSTSLMPILEPNGDRDGDGIDNQTEGALGTDPRNSDSDNDGYTDGEEGNSGANPNLATDIPPSRAYAILSIKNLSTLEYEDDLYFQQLTNSGYVLFTASETTSPYYNATSDYTPYTPYRWHAGVLETLQPPSGYTYQPATEIEFYAESMNEAGIVVGGYFDESTQVDLDGSSSSLSPSYKPRYAGRAVYWSNSSSEAAELAMPTYPASFVFAVPLDLSFSQFEPAEDNVSVLYAWAKVIDDNGIIYGDGLVNYREVQYVPPPRVPGEEYRETVIDEVKWPAYDQPMEQYGDLSSTAFQQNKKLHITMAKGPDNAGYYQSSLTSSMPQINRQDVNMFYRDLNASSQMLGELRTASGGHTGTMQIYDAQYQQTYSLPGAINETPFAFNSHWDFLAGSNGQSLWFENPRKPNVYVKTDLQALAAQAGWDLAFASKINDSGMIVGVAADSDEVKHAVLLLPVDMAVDSNRDGLIKFAGNYDDEAVAGKPVDTTSEEKPFRFWVNNDHDTVGVEYEGIQDDAQPSETNADCADGTISYERDLEDFVRLWINIGGMQDALAAGNIQVGLKWINVTEGEPAIQIYRPYETDGGKEYLTDDHIATFQASIDENRKAIKNAASENPFDTRIEPGSLFILPSDVVENLSVENPNLHLIFEACQRGTGQLVITFHKNDASHTEIGQGGSLSFELKDIKEMYERWSSEPTEAQDGGAPLAAARLSPFRLPAGVTQPFAYDEDSPEEKRYVVFVHGWNMDTWEKDSFAETGYKRLWHQGYKGRYAAYAWPDRYGFNWNNAIFNLQHYDESDWSAWLSAVPLSDLLVQLNQKCPGQVYAFAHSQGNIVLGEALRLNAIRANPVKINTYVACEAAIAGSIYDPILNTSHGMFYPPFTGPTSPDLFANWLTPNSGGVDRKFNFYNADDQALFLFRVNMPLRPDSGWFYDSGSANYYRGDDVSTGTVLNPGNTTAVQDRYEIYSFITEPRSRALGAIDAATISGFNGTSDLQTMWPPDGASPPYSGGQWHSGQFRFTNMDQKVFWQRLMNSFGIPRVE